MPAQLVVAVLQSLIPLHALAPSQAILASVVGLWPAVVSQPLRNSAAALAAIAMPVILLALFIADASLWSVIKRLRKPSSEDEHTFGNDSVLKQDVQFRTPDVTGWRRDWMLGGLASRLGIGRWRLPV
ncbi:MAG: hypothetical protein JSW48_14865 [Betaproteobacteria bacterium]|nr:MAG: hypothetical protein JSW48_14865 [Betaproteobacteria bacterium]